MVLTCVVAVLALTPSLLPVHASAESENPASQWLKKKKIGSGNGNDDGAPATANWSHAGAGGKAVTVTEIVNNGSVSPFLSADAPAALQAAEARYAAIVAAGGWDSVPSGKFKKGGNGKAVAALNRRLFVEGYLRGEATQGEFADLYTSATADAVTRFQRNHGLAVTGLVDGATLKELNIPAQKRLATIRANLPRVAEYSKDLGERYVVVNVPAMQIEAINNGTVYSIHNAIVGRPSRPTPVVATQLATVKFSPYWNAPPSIVERDILPRMQSGGASRVLNDMNIKVFDGVGGPEVDPDSINWRRVVIDNYHFRQEPGGSNAMATAKIEFSSPFGIYLHDTPEQHLFDTGQRFYSSGCVRVEKVAILINWILNGQDGIDSSRIAELAETKERLDVSITTPPQLRVAYLTAWPGHNGEVHFRPDVYELDGTGFVVGQPLPVGETSGGQRFVLKPVPRNLAAVDADEAGGFFNIFSSSRNSDKNTSTLASRSDAASDSLLNLKPKAKSKASKKSTNGIFAWASRSDDDARRPIFANASGKKKASKDAGKNKKKTTVAKADGKTPGKKLVKKDAATAAAKKADPAKAKEAEKCKADKDGKLPKGCKAPAVVAKAKPKPAAKPEPAAN